MGSGCQPPSSCGCDAQQVTIEVVPSTEVERLRADLTWSQAMIARQSEQISELAGKLSEITIKVQEELQRERTAVA